MNLFAENFRFWSWFGAVIRNFQRIRPWTTLLIIFMAATSRVCHVLAFFMPLKVVLLAGSPGIPRYFQFFIAPEQKMAWIIGLTIGAIVCYLLTVIFDALVDRLALAGSARILQQAQVIPLLNNQQVVAQGYYAKFCGIFADLIFVTAGLLVGLLINLQLFLFVIGMVAFLFVFSAYFVRGYDHVKPGKVAAYIKDNLNDYLKVLSSLIFLSAFIVLLIPLLLADYANILAAILSIIIIRQLMASQITIIKDAVSLAGAKHRIDALVFRDVQFQEKEAPEEVAFRELFNKKSRGRLAKRELGLVVKLSGKPEVAWLDPLIPGVNSFAITVAGEQAEERHHYRLDVFSPKHLQKLEHEAFLLSQVSRSGLQAPKLITQFFAGPFQCQICEAGAGERPAGAEWGAMQKALVGGIWSHQPPPGLVAAYCSSSILLPQRLDDGFVSSMEIAADTAAEEEDLRRFRENLPSLRQKLQKLPLCLFNPDLNPQQIMLTAERQPLVMTWCRWSLEPLGAGIPANLGQDVDFLASTISLIKEAREDMPADLAPQHLQLAAQCHELEKLIKGKRYKLALQQLDRIIQLGTQG